MCWYCDYNKKGDPYKNFRHGAVDESDFDDEIPYRHPKRRAKKGRARSQTRNVCLGSDDGKHVYVWQGYIPERPYYWANHVDDIVFYKHYGYHKREQKVCCGCEQTNGSRLTEKYLAKKENWWRKVTGGEYSVKRGEPVSGRYRWRGMTFYNFTWEEYDPQYVKALEAWKQTKEAKEVEDRRFQHYLELRRKYLGLTD